MVRAIFRPKAEMTLFLRTFGTQHIVGDNSLVVTRLPAAREGPRSNLAADKSLCFHENHCDTQLWPWAAH